MKTKRKVSEGGLRQERVHERTSNVKKKSWWKECREYGSLLKVSQA
jgi:hypothetical protein